MQLPVMINGQTYDIEGDEGYMAHVKNGFEPDTVNMLSLFCSGGSQVLDVGANIGMTALALTQICGGGHIVAIEPVMRTFKLLQRNLSVAEAKNVTALNFAAGAVEGSFHMQANPAFLAGAFVADKLALDANGHFDEVVDVRPLDKAFPEFPIKRVDFMKVDVEGYELEVLEGAKDLLKRFRPVVMLEMNHWCLSMFRRIPLPEFREKLLAIFPCVFAVEKSEFLDLGNDKDWFSIAHEHMIHFKFINLVAGFDREGVLKKLRLLKELYPQPSGQESSASAVDGGLRSMLSHSPAGPLLRGLKSTIKKFLR